MSHRPYRRAFFQGGVKNATIFLESILRWSLALVQVTYPCSARESSRIIVRIRPHGLHIISCEDIVGGGESRGPISNGLPVTVAKSDDEKREISVQLNYCASTREEKVSAMAR
jgi:hypothetical protein